ncbi:4-hydroxybenzoate octaprenyltransferase [bacterium BMS3Bbin06]|nr:4-hydroxybenzoate octaprenyltransferase [bacterium BMS3Abin08]GBE34928.1 4-hydroxybenzoate octaprenyltransferase [bacterium BMS3Bbin06]HDO36295.1 4-hydroxybenzoate octaprenyltransferase [Nitrospirota bacterium]HDY72246.1 4-hydroxybenzoate octaprenyltransferase [Nitrospirota bacterium]
MLKRAVLYLRMIRFSHSVFALPFAFTAALLAADGIPSLKKILWIAVAMVGGRSSAMGLNRIIDRKMDALNPRTSKREIPSGKIGLTEAFLFTLISTGVFIFAAYMLNPLCLKLSPFALAFFVLYPYTKRFTWLSHIVLGISISGATIGAWIAVRDSFNLKIIPMALAVVFWLAGFDILYALQDMDFDRASGLYSVPQRFGIRNSIRLSRISHILTWLLLLSTSYIFNLGVLFYSGIFIAGGLLLYEHSLIKTDDLSRLNMAFFNMNGYISVTVFIFTLLDILL